MSKTLDLVLLPQWYKQIKAGTKTKEYRDLKPYYIKRLCNAKAKGKCPYGGKPSDEECQTCFEKNAGTWKAAPYDTIRFHLKQSSESMEVPIKGIGMGKDATGKSFFVISLDLRPTKK